MLRSVVSPTAQHATRFACLFLRSTKVPPNTETVPALRGRPGVPHQGRLNLWLCLVLNTQGLTHPLPSPLPSPLFEFQFVQPTPGVLDQGVKSSRVLAIACVAGTRSSCKSTTIPVCTDTGTLLRQFFVWKFWPVSLSRKGKLLALESGGKTTSTLMDRYH